MKEVSQEQIDRRIDQIKQAVLDAESEFKKGKDNASIKTELKAQINGAMNGLLADSGLGNISAFTDFSVDKLKGYEPEVAAKIGVLIGKIQKEFASLDKKVDKAFAKLEKMNKKSSFNKRDVLGIALGLVVACIGIAIISNASLPTYFINTYNYSATVSNMRPGSFVSGNALYTLVNVAGKEAVMTLSKALVTLGIVTSTAFAFLPVIEEDTPKFLEGLTQVCATRCVALRDAADKFEKSLPQALQAERAEESEKFREQLAQQEAAATKGNEVDGRGVS